MVAKGLGEDIQKFLDSMAFENWAPRSSQAWRLGRTPRSLGKGATEGTEQGGDQKNVEKLEDGIHMALL